MADPGGGAAFVGPLLVAGNFAVTLAFYRDTLALPVRGERPYAECEMPSGTFSIVDEHFWSSANGSDVPVIRGSGGSPQVVLSIQVPDVDDAFERLMSLEVKFLSPPTNRTEMAIRNAFLRDPDGRTLQLFAPLPPPPGMR